MGFFDRHQPLQGRLLPDRRLDGGQLILLGGLGLALGAGCPPALVLKLLVRNLER